MKIAIFGNSYQERYIEGIRRLIGVLKQRGVEIAIEKEFLAYLAYFIGKEVREIAAADDFCADLALSIGGDGTFLHTAAMVGEKSIPIVGVNTGRLGYLAEVLLDDFEAFWNDYEDGRCAIERRSLLKVETDAGIKLPHRFALNEVAVLKSASASMLEMDTKINGAELTQYLGDGLIISTPTGSTAYNLSVGGPILHPQSRCMVISPIAAHSLTMRPLVIPDDRILDITTRGRSPMFRLSIDGVSLSLPIGSRVVLRKADHDLLLLQRGTRDFAAVLRNKLMWGADTR